MSKQTRRIPNNVIPRWNPNLANYVIKSTTFSISREYWYCTECKHKIGETKNIPKPECCNYIIEKTLDFAKLASHVNMDVEKLKKEYEADETRLEQSEGYMKREDFEWLVLADGFWDIKRCPSRKIVKITDEEILSQTCF